MSFRGVVGRGVLFCACVLGASVGTHAQTVERAPGREKDVAEIEALITKYAKAADTADPTLASEVWAHDDVSFIHPQGHERGWEAIKTNVYEKLMGETFSERHLSVRDVAIHAYSDAAWAEFSWDFVAKIRKDGSTVETQGEETQVYRRVDGRWRLVHVHYSGIPVRGRGQGS